MSIQDFIDYWTGKFCDFDKGGSYECVDIMRQFIQDVLKLPGYSLHTLGATGGAKDLFLKFADSDAKNYTKITNNPTNVPNPGDIIVFKTSLLLPWLYGVKGHVGIVKEASVMKVIYFCQNYPTGHSCQLISSNYKDCLGWIRKK